MAEADYALLGQNIARLMEGQHEILKRLDRMHTELEAQRNELRRLAESQMDGNRALRGMRDDINLMVRTEIGGLFAHLETRLEQYIDEHLRNKEPT